MKNPRSGLGLEEATQHFCFAQHPVQLGGEDRRLLDKLYLSLLPWSLDLPFGGSCALTFFKGMSRFSVQILKATNLLASTDKYSVAIVSRT